MGVGIHNTSPERLRQIAADLWSEGWYTIAQTIAEVAEEKEQWLVQQLNGKRPSVSDDAKQVSDLMKSGVTQKMCHRCGAISRDSTPSAASFSEPQPGDSER